VSAGIDAEVLRHALHAARLDFEYGLGRSRDIDQMIEDRVKSGILSLGFGFRPERQ